MNETEPIIPVLMKYKKGRIDKLVKLAKMIKKAKRIMDNNIFESEQRNFFKRIEARSMKEPCQRWTSMLHFGEVSGKEITVRPICCG